MKFSNSKHVQDNAGRFRCEAFQRLNVHDQVCEGQICVVFCSSSTLWAFASVEVFRILDMKGEG